MKKDKPTIYSCPPSTISMAFSRPLISPIFLSILLFLLLKYHFYQYSHFHFWASLYALILLFSEVLRLLSSNALDNDATIS